MVWMLRSSKRRTGMRSETRALQCILPRLVETVTQPALSTPFSAASSGLISQNSSGWSSESQGIQRDIAPLVWCSVSRYVVTTYGYFGSIGLLYGLSGRSKSLAVGLYWTLS